ncbi:MAG: hypothetical protein D6762_07315 [Candidatus Neomarinimicrobiota bacterium]|nr:MAG: hypothetical protein D6762_07315 [Candidatus Neomarinimicrobiota bacterium]
MNQAKIWLYGSALIVGLLMILFTFWLPAPSKTESPVRVQPSAAAPRGNPGTAPMAGSRTTPGQGNVGNLQADIPATWQQQAPASSMRLTQFRLPALNGDREDAQLAVFNQIGGTVEQNLNRWYGQFTQPDGSSSASRARRETFQANSMPVTFVTLKGTYSAGPMAMGGAPGDKPHFGLLAAIVSTPEGPYYFKLTGPEKTVDGYEQDFRNFLKSMVYVK